jgi:hypothetical protein
MSFKIEPCVVRDPFAWCDICGLRYHYSELRITWDNKMACVQDWDERPDFFYRLPVFRHEGQPVKNPRPKYQINERSPYGPLDYAGLDPKRPL